MAESYRQGQIDGIQLVGQVCTGHDCSDCAVGQMVGDSMTCFEFMSQYPNKMLSLMSEEASKDYTFYNEYRVRFPYSNLTVDELAACTCRKALFGGTLECDLDESKCVECWNATYTGDVE